VSEMLSDLHFPSRAEVVQRPLPGRLDHERMFHVVSCYKLALSRGAGQEPGHQPRHQRTGEDRSPRSEAGKSPQDRRWYRPIISTEARRRLPRRRASRAALGPGRRAS
jgi:hypothetical protein